MTRRPKHDAPADDADDATPSVRELAPVEHNEDADPIEHVAEPAHVFPTEADVERIRAELLDADPSLAHASHHIVDRALRPAIAAEADRLSRQRPHARAQAATHRSDQLAALVAPVFPTDDHVIALHAALPSITADDAAAVLHAGHAAFVATLAAGEPIFEVPDDSEAA